ncbi:MAG: hypothetical protein GX443_06290 [Deltaproteobacteria bacterium]|nr:hypothetical protein [Deltaproteobacteria bacterium]
MLPDAYISHRTETRLRIKIPCKRKDRRFFSRVTEALSGQEGIERVVVNPLTGSLLLIHRLAPGIVEERLRRARLFSLDAPRQGSSGLFETVSSAFRAANETVKEISRGELDIAGIVFAILMFSGLYQISRGNFMAPAWYTAFWYAMGIIMKAVPGRE